MICVHTDMFAASMSSISSSWSVLHFKIKVLTFQVTFEFEMNLMISSVVFILCRWREGTTARRPNPGLTPELSPLLHLPQTELWCCSHFPPKRLMDEVQPIRPHRFSRFVRWGGAASPLWLSRCSGRRASAPVNRPLFPTGTCNG